MLFHLACRIQQISRSRCPRRTREINDSSWHSSGVAVHCKNRLMQLGDGCYASSASLLLTSRRKLSNTTLVTGLWNLHREEWPSHDRYQERCWVCSLSKQQMESLRNTSFHVWLFAVYAQCTCTLRIESEIFQEFPKNRVRPGVLEGRAHQATEVEDVWP